MVPLRFQRRVVDFNGLRCGRAAVVLSAAVLVFWRKAAGGEGWHGVEIPAMIELGFGAGGGCQQHGLRWRQGRRAALAIAQGVGSYRRLALPARHAKWPGVTGGPSAAAAPITPPQPPPSRTALCFLAVADGRARASALEVALGLGSSIHWAWNTQNTHVIHNERPFPMNEAQLKGWVGMPRRRNQLF